MVRDKCRRLGATQSSHEQNSGRIFRIGSKGEHLETIFVKIIARLPPQVQE